ncbi:putative Fungal specific transcription factor [Fonsecaea pedrosoi]|nr:putative Fungal specific transcription factor [Fonsecaea pedrosoi]
MPRPKVRPEDRQRSAKACLPCKASKKRCNAQQPCSNCVRRRTPSSCRYIEPGHARHLVPQSRDTQPQVLRRPGDESSRVVGASRYGNSTVSEVSTQIPGATNSASPAVSALTPQKLTGGRMLLNSRGDKVYIGGFASLSFLQFLRRTIRQQMGPSLFTENTRRHVMLEATSLEDTNHNFIEDVDQKRSMIDVYFAATNGIVDLFSREEVEVYLTIVNTPNIEKREYMTAALDLIVAIGAQCRAADQSDRQYAVRLFSRAQKMALASGLEDPCLDMVRCFLLMTFYMLGACRRNAAFMYMGIASQAASALGLHVTEQYRHFNVSDQNVRLRTLKTLRVLDVMYCSILGRPYSTGAIRTDRVALNNMDIRTSSPREVTLNASFRVCTIIADITQRLDCDGSISLGAAQEFLKRLQEWSLSLPDDMRQFKKPIAQPLTLPEQEQMIGNIHVSCVYYFAVMLVTRPFLISHLMHQMTGIAGEGSDTMAISGTQADVVDVAQACIDAAMLMANVCYEALQSNILLKQMCIMKAWVFAAGLVLGFSMFALSESRFDMDDSFNNAREVLRNLSLQSPQAEHYYEILSGFADVILRHRQHLSREKRRFKNKYVDQILTLDVSPSAAGSQSTSSPRTPLSTERNLGVVDSAVAGGSIIGGDDGGLGSEFDPNEQLQMTDYSQWPLENGGGFDFGMFGWDNFAMQISENFSLDNEAAWGVT